MDSEKLCSILSFWDQAGEQPYEVLKEEGLYDDFVNYLSTIKEPLNDIIYRGTQRHSELEVGDTLNYQYPTSWSFDFDIACKFIDNIPNSIILSLTSKIPISMVYNDYNTNDEDEVILAPYVLKVTRKRKEGETTILEVEPQ